MKKPYSIFLFILAWNFVLLADPGLIQLRENTIDPSTPKTFSAALPQCSPTAQGRYQFILQPSKNFSFEETLEIENLGIKIVGTIPPNAYIILATPEELTFLKARFEIEYSGEYLPEYKIENRAKLNLAKMDEPFLAAISLASKELYPEVAAFLKANGSDEKTFQLMGSTILQASVTEDLVSRLLKLSSVLDVAKLSEIKPNNNVAKSEKLMNVEKVNKTGYTGKGVTVAVVDSGLDSGNLTNNFHPDFQNKSVTAILSRNSSQSSWYDLQGHGTHVTASAVGTGAAESGKYAGTAPDASLFFICIGMGYYNLCYVADEDIAKAYNAGARVMNNSWGDTEYTGSYTYNSVWFDDLANTYPDMLMVFSCGNENDDVESEYNVSIHSLAACKNVLSVAAAESYRPERTETYGSLHYTANSFFYNELAAFPSNGVHQGMGCFSSRGPCRGGRLKPDIAAPGTMIYSAESLYDTDNYGKGEHVVMYKFLSGTSMAAPLTTGACADILQHLHENGVSNPSSALIKAVILNGARPMGKGQYDGYVEIPDRTPNNVSGYGHVDLSESINPKGGILLTAEGIVTNSGDMVSFPCSKMVKGPVRITLCWTDYHGTAGAMNALVNDLDLMLSDGEQTYYVGGALEHTDYKNNVEQIWIEDFSPGDDITISVKGYNVMRGPQRFAIAVSGIDEMVPEPTLAIFVLLSLLLFRKK